MAQRWLMKLLKLVFIISTASFLIVQIQLRRRDVTSSNDNGSGIGVGGGVGGFINLPNQEFGPGKMPDDIQSRPTVNPPYPNNNLNKRPNSTATKNLGDNTLYIQTLKSLTNLSSFGGGDFSSFNFRNLPNFEEIRKSIEDNNANAVVQNENEFGPVEDVSHVVVVQVHNRSKYLDKLIQSLSKAKYIDRTLLIFSHDYYSIEINTLVKSIKFCRVMQIFYPYSLQIYPDRFPGQDPRDCAADVGREKAAETKCQNWEHPDKYGHFRVAKYSQVKHHWWWKMNYVFDGIARLKNYTGWVLLLEEDHYVSPDFLHVFDLIIRNKASYCAECSVITLGFYLKSYAAYGSSMNKLAIYPWFSSRHNMGMSINRATWSSIRTCAKNFCAYDDYNWDWSLMHVNLKCLSPSMTVLYAKSPRVFHIGDCGIHHTGKQCTADTSATKVTSILEGAKDHLYPDKLEVSERSRRTLKAPKENGGWGDIRDHELCLNHTLNLKNT